MSRPGTVTVLFAVVAALLAVATLTSCASLYFNRLASPNETFRIEHLRDLGWRELWQGFVFNGEKVGFTRLVIEEIPGSDRCRLVSEAELRILFLGMEKRISIKSEDIVGPDLALLSFRYEEDIGGGPVIVEGVVEEGVFRSTRRAGDAVQTFERELYEPVYPTSVINLYPVQRGLSVGARWRYPVYDPQAQSISEVVQSVESFEESDKLDIAPSYRLTTSMGGNEVSTWINMRGEPVFELGMAGALITVMESERDARRYLIEAGLNKKDFILDFSLVKTAKPLPCPRETVYLELTLDGVAAHFPPVEGPGQEARLQENGTTIHYRISSSHDGAVPREEEFLPKEMRILYLFPSPGIESDAPEIRETALTIAGGADDTAQRMRLLARWVAEEIADEAVDNPSALKVLNDRRGECQAHTILFTALARSLGIPTRLAGGLLYVEDLGFLYHSWAECYLDGWIAVDATLGQVGIDAAHVKLVQGHDLAATYTLGNIVGNVNAAIIDYRALCPHEGDAP